jgi:hypothetical protein
MTRRKARWEFELPHSIFGRAIFALACLVMMPVAGFLLYGAVFEWPVPQQPLRDMIAALAAGTVIELLSVGLFVFSFCGFVWSLFGSEWAAGLLQAGFRKLSRTVVLMTIVFWTFIGLVVILAIVGIIK